MTTEPVAASSAHAGQALDGAVCLVTGGARGLGAEICRELAGAGMHVIAADVRVELAQALCDDLQAAGGRADAVALDVTDAQAAQSVVDEIVRRHGSLDVLVNNAGIDRTVAIDEMSVADWDRI